MIRSPNIKLLTDENFSVQVVENLIGKGYDVLDIKYAGLHTLPDTQIFDLAIEQQRILLTHDIDYLQISRQHAYPTSSVIILPSNQNPELMTARILRVLQTRLIRKKRAYVVIIESDQLQINAL